MVLILRHLVNAGYVNSYQSLSNETKLNLDKIDTADNIDLLDILQVCSRTSPPLISML